MSSHVTTFCHRLSHGGATLTELYSHVTRSGLESAPVLLTDLRHAIMDISNEWKGSEIKC